MILLDSILEYIFGTLTKKPLPPTSTSPQSPASIASDIVTKTLNAETLYILHKQLNEEVSPNAWSDDTIAIAILHGLENAIKAGGGGSSSTQMARAAADAVAKCKHAAAAAIDFASEHPAYATLIAVGVLGLLMPWALEILGFGDLGPIEGSFAAAWQRTYPDYVPKGALFGYFQRLGMV